METKMSTNTGLDFTQKFPDEVSLQVFAYLDDQSLVKSGGICGEWRRIAGDDSLWKNRLPDGLTPKGIKPKEYFIGRAVSIKEREKILIRIENFLSRFSLRDLTAQIGFKYLFSFNPEYLVEVQLKPRGFGLPKPGEAVMEEVLYSDVLLPAHSTAPTELSGPVGNLVYRISHILPRVDRFSLPLEIWSGYPELLERQIAELLLQKLGHHD